jgi:hypothetical protein
MKYKIAIHKSDEGYSVSVPVPRFLVPRREPGNQYFDRLLPPDIDSCIAGRVACHGLHCCQCVVVAGMMGMADGRWG